MEGGSRGKRHAYTHGWFTLLYGRNQHNCCYVASVVSNSVRPHRRQPTRLPRPRDSPGKNVGVGCHFLLQCMKVKSECEVTQSYLTLSDPMDCSLPGSSIHRIFQARVLEWRRPVPSPYIPQTCSKNLQLRSDWHKLYCLLNNEEKDMKYCMYSPMESEI